MVLIDNRIGGTLMIGDESNENTTQLAVFKDSVFYGETEARDCSSENMCSVSAKDTYQCVDKSGLMLSYFSKSGR